MDINIINLLLLNSLDKHHVYKIKYSDGKFYIGYHYGSFLITSIEYDILGISHNYGKFIDKNYKGSGVLLTEQRKNDKGQIMELLESFDNERAARMFEHASIIEINWLNDSLNRKL